MGFFNSEFNLTAVEDQVIYTGEVFELMEKKKSKKTTTSALKEEIEKLKADIAWLQRQINDLKDRRR